MGSKLEMLVYISRLKKVEDVRTIRNGKTLENDQVEEKRE